MGNEFMITPIQKNKVYEDISTQIKKQIEDGTFIKTTLILALKWCV